MARPAARQLLVRLRLAVAAVLITNVVCAPIKFDYKKFGLDWLGECASGRAQSPINIVPSRAIGTSTNNFSLSYEPITKGYLASDGHGFVVRLDQNSTNILNTPEGPYKLVQFHFHAFSEHTINGLFAPLEVHFVHASPDGKKLAVFGVLFRLHPDNSNSPFLSNFVGSLPNDTTAKIPKTFSLKPFLQPGNAKTLSYFNYMGSLTTPPCSEIVTWYVRRGYAKASVEDFEAFLEGHRRTTGDPLDDRPPQPIQGRKVYKVIVKE